MRVEKPARITPMASCWPSRLSRLGADEPEAIHLFGNADLLDLPSLALFCSVRAPGRVLVESYDVGRTLAASDAVVIGGFHSPVEREILDELLRGAAAVIICPARSLEGMSIPRRWRAPVAEGRLLLVSAGPLAIRRATSVQAERRNRLAAALSSRVLMLHAASGGRLARLASECSTWGVPLHCLDHSANEDLLLLGATRLPSCQAEHRLGLQA